VIFPSRRSSYSNRAIGITVFADALEACRSKPATRADLLARLPRSIQNMANAARAPRGSHSLAPEKSSTRSDDVEGDDLESDNLPAGPGPCASRVGPAEQIPAVETEVQSMAGVDPDMVRATERAKTMQRGLFAHGVRSACK